MILETSVAGRHWPVPLAATPGCASAVPATFGSVPRTPPVRFWSRPRTFGSSARQPGRFPGITLGMRTRGRRPGCPGRGRPGRAVPPSAAGAGPQVL